MKGRLSNQSGRWQQIRLYLLVFCRNTTWIIISGSRIKALGSHHHFGTRFLEHFPHQKQLGKVDNLLQCSFCSSVLSSKLQGFITFFFSLNILYLLSIYIDVVCLSKKYLPGLASCCGQVSFWVYKWINGIYVLRFV